MESDPTSSIDPGAEVKNYAQQTICLMLQELMSYGGKAERDCAKIKLRIITSNNKGWLILCQQQR